MRTLFTVALLGSVAVAGGSATRFPALQRKPVLETPLPSANPPVRLVRGAQIRFAPLQPTGLHYHPVSTVGVVTDGEILFQPEGETARTLHPGQSFFEPAGRRIVHFDNASSTKTATVTVFYLTDSMKRPLIFLLDK